MRAPALALAAVAVLLTAGPAAAATVERLPESLRDQLPQDLPAAPSRSALADSVVVYDPDGLVVAYSVDDSVEVLQTEQREGGTTTVTVNSDVLFAFASDVLDERARAAVTAVAADLPQAAALQVVGHTDGIGDGPANQALSERRARAVAAALVQGRPDLRPTPTGRGETEPVEPEGGPDDADARAVNRRVVISYQG